MSSKNNRRNLPFFIKRKLTRKEAARITKEVMESGITYPPARFELAVFKAMKVTNNG